MDNKEMGLCFLLNKDYAKKDSEKNTIQTFETSEINHSIYEDRWDHMREFRHKSPGNRFFFYILHQIFCTINSTQINTVLDAGCGSGARTCFLGQQLKKATVLGIDFSSIGINLAIEENKGVPNLNFRCVEVDDDSIWQDSYDMVSCFDVLEHLDDWKSLACKFAERSNKYILISVPVGRMRKYEKEIGHVRNFKRGELEEFFSAHSFKPIDIYYAGFPFYNPIGRDLSQLMNKTYEYIYNTDDSILTKIYNCLFFFLFRYCSTKRKYGELFIGLFEKYT